MENKRTHTTTTDTTTTATAIAEARAEVRRAWDAMEAGDDRTAEIATEKAVEIIAAAHGDDYDMAHDMVADMTAEIAAEVYGF